ncbi:Hypothetical protein NTJ_14190 [Nesidiocoris tenuis]|uniref:Uncharacterized protein n=1 Tax=Nesidiocoris tenuis TaxID=355587 RepID=A0ABN7BAN2_9HEMI|nr:Hypothetical protein NTJ_14190 [Nesidiocoris tenuis]
MATEQQRQTSRRSRASADIDESIVRRGSRPRRSFGDPAALFRLPARPFVSRVATPVKTRSRHLRAKPPSHRDPPSNRLPNVRTSWPLV